MVKFLAIALFANLLVFAQTENAFQNSRVAGAESGYTIDELISAVNVIISNTPEECTEAKAVKNSAKYTTTFDNQGKPCRIYDLSFPTLRTLFQPRKISSIPVQNFAGSDYLNWLDGYYDEVYAKIDEFNKNFKREDVLDSWYGELKFKHKTNPKTTIKSEFRLSDLDLGNNIKFNDKQKKVLRLALSSSELSEEYIDQFVNNPEKLFSMVRFDWNELNHVFDIILDFQFLPINGPIAPVDYRIQYKYIVEKMLRSIVFKALDYLTNLIPEPMTQKIVKIVLNDINEFMTSLYETHLNSLEDTLRMNLNGTIKTDIDKATVEKGLNLVFTSRSNLIMEYMMSYATGNTFDLNALDKVGANARYTVEKQRLTLRSELHSRLVLNYGCKTELMHDYFAVCSLKGEKAALFSLLSEHKIYFINLGGPLVHYYKMPSAVFMIREISWLLSLAARISELAIPNFLTNALVKVLKGFSVAGAQDEAFLLNYLMELKRNNLTVNENYEYHAKWLFADNINPFLLRSEASEDKIIEKNMSIIESNLNQN